MLKYVKTLGTVGMELMYFSSEKGINFGVPGAEYYGLNVCVPSILIC